MSRRNVTSAWRIACTRCGREWDHVADGHAWRTAGNEKCGHCGSYRLHADLMWRRRFAA